MNESESAPQSAMALCDGESPDSPPDWMNYERELPCPLCNYNLRGLIEARCPECGSIYTWTDLLDTRRHEHPYLFEHHPTRNLWSFGRTLVGGLRHRVFWSTLSPLQPTSLKRMLLYAGLVWALSVFVYGLSIPAHASVRFDIQYQVWGGYAFLESRGEAILSFSTETYVTPDFAVIVSIPLLWAMYTYFSFSLLSISMKRARVRQVHVLRAVVYSFDIVFWVAMAIAALFVLSAIILALTPTVFRETARDMVEPVEFAATFWVALVIVCYFWMTARPAWRERKWLAAICWSLVVTTGVLTVFCLEHTLSGNDWSWITDTRPPMSVPILLFGWAVFVGRLVTAFRQYLRFKHSVAVVVSSQIIAVLAIPVTIIVAFGIAGFF